MPDAHALATLALTAVALFLFSRERVPLATSSLAVLVALVLGFQLFPYETPAGPLKPSTFFLGFGHEALVAVCALMVAGHALVRTGALEPVGLLIARVWRVSPQLSLLLTLAAAAVLSAFVNNTPIVVLLIPILMAVAVRSQQSATGLLLPMGFATIIGGMATTIGTSTNLLVVSIAASLGLREIRMFDFLLPAAIAGAVALVYLWLVAPRLLPERAVGFAPEARRLFTAQLRVQPGGFAERNTLAELVRRTHGKMRVLRIRKSSGGYLGMATAPLPDAILNPGDQLTVIGTPAELKEYEKLLGASLYAGDRPVDEEHPLSQTHQQLAQLVLLEGSRLAGQTLRASRFDEAYQIVTLAIHRPGTPVKELPETVQGLQLKVGDVLLVQGPPEQIAALKQSATLLVLDGTLTLPLMRRAPLALTIMAGIVVLAATGILPIAISALTGALLMIFCGCLAWRDVADALSIPVILIIVVSLALGAAMIETGAAAWLADLFVIVTRGLPAPVVLSFLMLLMAGLTSVVSNNAAAVIGTPIAIDIARALQLPPEAFVLAVLFGANLCFATPMAYQTNLLVMGAGDYRFADFVRVGLPLLILMWLSLSFLLPRLYGF